MSDDKLSGVFSKCREDAAFKKRFLADPGAVLGAEGFDVPEGVEVKVVENLPGTLHIVLPSELGSSDLSDADLEQIAGGLHQGPLRTKFSLSRVREIYRIYTKSQGKECIPW